MELSQFSWVDWMARWESALLGKVRRCNQDECGWSVVTDFIGRQLPEGLWIEEQTFSDIEQLCIRGHFGGVLELIKILKTCGRTFQWVQLDVSTVWDTVTAQLLPGVQITETKFFHQNRTLVANLRLGWMHRLFTMNPNNALYIQVAIENTVAFTNFESVLTWVIFKWNVPHSSENRQKISLRKMRKMMQK